MTMISEANFLKLRQGDRLLLKAGESRRIRTVMAGPGDPDGGRAVTLPILKHSWTGRAYTVRGWNDIKHQVVRVLRSRGTLMTKGERQHLSDIGFNVREQFVRTIKEERARKLRLGRELCANILPLPTVST